jgi:hydrogenase/urease accessory protein HupE
MRRLLIHLASAVLLGGAAPASAHDLPMGGSRWRFGEDSIVANLDLSPALLAEIKGIKEAGYPVYAMSDEQMRRVAADVLQPYIDARLSITQDGKSYPVKVDRIESNGDIYTAWLSVEHLTPRRSVTIDYRLLFEETRDAHVNLAYGYMSEATGESLRKLFDFSAPALQHTFDHSAHAWTVVIPGSSPEERPKVASDSSHAIAKRGEASLAPKRRRIMPASATGATTAAPIDAGPRASPPAAQGSAPPPQAQPRTRAPDTSPNAGGGAPLARAAEASPWASAGKFVLLGVEHILTGYDHIAFLLAVIVIGLSLREVLKIITAFTLAHSITLLLAALELVRVNSRLVEAVIAASICYVALENLFLRKAAHRWMLTFGFGLIHGFGFASALRGLIVGRPNLLVSVVSFNVGVELGQVIIFLVLLPVLRLLASWVESRRVTIGASLAILALGLAWLAERTIHWNVFASFG